MVDASIRAASHPGHRILGRVRSPIHLSNSTRLFVPAARFLRPGFAFPLRSPGLRGGGAPRDVRMLARHPLGLHVTRQARHLPRRLASPYGGRPPLGALTVAIFGSGAALPSPAFAPDQSQRAPRARVVVPGSRLSVTSRDDGSRAAAAGRHSSLRIQVWLENTPQLSEDANLYRLYNR